MCDQLCVRLRQHGLRGGLRAGLDPGLCRADDEAQQAVATTQPAVVEDELRWAVRPIGTQYGHRLRQSCAMRLGIHRDDGLVPQR